MKNFDYYNTNPNDIKISSGKIIFEKQLNGIEGEQVKINDSKDLTKVVIKNTLNPMTELKEERSIQFTMDTRIKRGDYIEYLDGEEKVTYMVLSRIDNHKSFKKAKMRYCNQTLMCKGQPYPIYCIADNTTYGTKGVKDNIYFEERDARLKIWVQKNKWTDRYQENMRFIFNHRICYEVTKIDDTVLDGIYVMECILDALTSVDDLENNIAFNKDFDEKNEIIKNNDIVQGVEKETNIEPDIFTVEKCKVGEKIKIKINPEDAELKTDEYGKLTLINKGEYEFTGVLAGDYATLQLIKNEKILKEKYILIY